MGISLLSPVLQTCQASNVADCEFPGVCALFTGSCRATFCGAVGASGVHWSSGSHTGTITPIDHGKGEDIKGVCHAYTHFCFHLNLCLAGGKSIERALV